MTIRLIKKKILIMGLPGSGKTTLAKNLNTKLDSKWLNADKVRKDFDDFDEAQDIHGIILK